MKRPAVLALLSLLLVLACKQGEEPASGTAGYAADGKPQAQKSESAPAAGAEVGSTMPEYSALWLDGSKFDLASRRGKVVLLNVWATWCGPCRYEIPELQAIHAKYAPRGFEVLGVSVDESGPDAVRQFVDEHKMTYPVALDAEGGRIATLLETTMLPTTVLLDRNGKIVWKKFGAILPNDQELTEAIEKTL